MRRFSLVFLSLAFVCSNAASAQGTVADEARHHFDVPHIVIDGIIAYHDKGPDAAVQTWMANSSAPMRGVAQQQADILRKLPFAYGSFRDFEVLGTENLSQRVRIVYVVLNYDKGPIFGSFNLYRSVDQGWLVTKLAFSETPDIVLPATMLTPAVPQ